MIFESWRASGESRSPADGVVAVLQRELLMPVDPEVGSEHIEAMILEAALNRPAFVEEDRSVGRAPRRVLGVAVVAGALTFMSGLGAVGALPAPAQHWLSRVTRHIGIHLPDPSSGPLHAPDNNAPTGGPIVRRPPLGRTSPEAAPGPPTSALTGAPNTSKAPATGKPAPAARRDNTAPARRMPSGNATVSSPPSAGGTGSGSGNSSAGHAQNTTKTNPASNRNAATAHAKKTTKTNADRNRKSVTARTHAQKAAKRTTDTGATDSTAPKPGRGHKAP